MAWDFFSTEPEFEEKLEWIRNFVREEIEPLEVIFPPSCEFLPLNDERRRIVDPLKQKVRDQGLWAPHLGPELGGQGFGGGQTHADQRNPRSRNVVVDHLRHTSTRYR